MVSVALSPSQSTSCLYNCFLTLLNEGNKFVVSILKILPSFLKFGTLKVLSEGWLLFE